MRKVLLVLMSLFVLLVLAACGGEDNTVSEEEASGKAVQEVAVESSVEEEDTTIEVTDFSGKTLTFESAPESIASLSSGDLDILLALGANVTGRPTTRAPISKELEGITEIGNPHQPAFEKIAEINPEVLVAGMSFKQYAANIEQQGTKVVYTQANSIEDIQKTISLFGQMFENETEAESLNESITEQLNSLVVESDNPVKTLLVYGSPGSYMAALPNSLSGDLLAKAGGENIASDFSVSDKYPQYASLSIEKIIERNPSVVMLITHGDPEAVKAAFEQEMEKNAAWKNLDAVKNGKVIILPSHLFGTNPGTKVIEALETMKESLAGNN